MPLIRPRLTDYYDLPVAQAECDFAIPLLDEDLPLYVDPFLMWKSPSMQDNALHTASVTAFSNLIDRFATGDRTSAVAILNGLSECPEAGLGTSANRKGRRMGVQLAEECLAALAAIPQIREKGVAHFEVVQLLVNGIGADRISDIALSMIKSFLIDFTIEQAKKHAVPIQQATVPEVFDYKSLTFSSVSVPLPVSPATGAPVLLVPKRWLRYTPWLGLDPYFDGGHVKGEGAPQDRAGVVLYNRDHFGLIQAFVTQREAIASQCSAAGIFEPMSSLSAKRRLSTLRKLPTGKTDGADREFEENAGAILASTLHPYLDFAGEQSRTDSGVLIRDVVFYNTRTWDFLQDIHRLYESRQLVFELKNVKELDREHVNQLNRYLVDQFGRFGVFVTRNTPPKAVMKQMIDLWSGHRRSLVVLTDQDLEDMVTVFESGQRRPIEILKRAYVNQSRLYPS